jgi:hypothetical protein
VRSKDRSSAEGNRGRASEYARKDKMKGIKKKWQEKVMA